VDFAWTPEQNERYAAAARFAAAALTDDVVARDLAGEFPRELWRRAAEHGVLRWPIPAEQGGAGLPVTTVVRMLEGLGYGCPDNGLTFALGAQLWGVQMALSHFGTPAQRERHLVPAMAGERLGAFAMTEEGSGSDAFELASTARQDGDAFVLDGEKVLITFAPVADFAIVFAKTDPSAGRWGITAFLVDAATDGFTAHAVESKMGLRTVPFGRLTLEGCRVPAEAVLGRIGAGASLFGFSQGCARSLVLAPQLGAMQRLLEACVHEARTSRRGGVPIGRHQAVAHRIVEMKLRLETARLLLYRTAWLQEGGEPNLQEAALTKIHVSEACRASCLDAIAVFGGEGYKTAAGVERHLRDAIGATIYGGTVDIQRNIVAGLLGL